MHGCRIRLSLMRYAYQAYKLTGPPLQMAGFFSPDVYAARFFSYRYHYRQVQQFHESVVPVCCAPDR